MPSSKLVESVGMLAVCLDKVCSNIQIVSDLHAEAVVVKVLTTLPDEHVHSQMRLRYPMPTQLEYAYLLTPTVQEAIKRIADCGCVYYTHRKSYYYDVPSIP